MYGGVKNERQNYSCMHRMQPKKLRQEKEQEKWSRQTWNEEILQILQKAYSS